MSDTIQLFGLAIRNETLDEAVERIARSAKSGVRQIVFFINAHCVNVASNHSEYLSTIPRADQIYADGIGMKIAARLCGTPLADNVNGTDLFPKLCEQAEQEGVALALLGAQPGIAACCAEKMQALFPRLNIPFIQDGYFKPEEESSLIDRINRSGARILLVAFGVPGQELWIARNSDRIQTPVILAVGGLFDFYSGRRRRAPWLLRKLGLEWCVRLAQEPARLFKRYVLGNPVFLGRTFALRLLGKRALSERVCPCKK